MSRQLVCLFEVVHCGIIRLELILSESQHSDDAVERRSYLVRHTEKEARFQAIFVLDLLDALLVFFLALVFLCAAPEHQQLVLIISAALCYAAYPLAVLLLSDKKFSVVRGAEAVPQPIGIGVLERGEKER